MLLFSSKTCIRELKLIRKSSQIRKNLNHNNKDESHLQAIAQ